MRPTPRGSACRINRVPDPRRATYIAAMTAPHVPTLPCVPQVGRVVRVEHGVVRVLVDGVPERATYGGGLLARVARSRSETPCVGDFADLRRWPGDRLTLERLHPRATTLSGPVERAAAANVDLVGIVVPGLAGALGPLLDLVRRGGAVPLLLGDELALDPGLVRLRALLAPGLTLVVTGGPARSDLVRALVGDLALRAGARRTLHVLPGGGAVVEVPPLRAVA